nr:hypothetical protein [Maliibacterium massiliense]
MQLRNNLAALPQEELDSAVSYYCEYFDDNGPENEQRVLEELGDPAAIARQIVAEYHARIGQQQEEAPPTSDASDAPKDAQQVCAQAVLQMPQDQVPADAALDGQDCARDMTGDASNAQGAARQASQDGAHDTRYAAQETARPLEAQGAPRRMPTGMIMVLVLLSPLLLVLGAAVFALFIALLAVALSVLAVGVVMGITAIACLVVGIMALFVHAPSGLLLLGTSLVLAALTILFNLGGAALLKAIVRLYRFTWRSIFHKRGHVQ